MRKLLLVLVGTCAVVLPIAGCGQDGQGGQDSGQAGSTTTGEPSLGASLTQLPPALTLPATPTAPGSGDPIPKPTGVLPLPVPPNPTASQVDVPPALMDQIRADAAQRVGVQANQIQVISSTAQTWSDGSLGCPKPGESYIQVMTEGFQVIVQAGNRALDYRTSQNSIKVCEQY